MDRVLSKLTCSANDLGSNLIRPGFRESTCLGKSSKICLFHAVSYHAGSRETNGNITENSRLLQAL